MRLRITRQPSGCVDGICLDELTVGSVYEIGTTLACYLLAERFAEPADESIPAQLAPWSEMHFDLSPRAASEETSPHSSRMDELSEAADRQVRPRLRIKPDNPENTDK